MTGLRAAPGLPVCGPRRLHDMSLTCRRSGCEAGERVCDRDPLKRVTTNPQRSKRDRNRKQGAIDGSERS